MSGVWMRKRCVQGEGGEVVRVCVWDMECGWR